MTPFPCSFEVRPHHLPIVLTHCLWGGREAGKVGVAEPTPVSFRKRDGGGIQGASMEAACEEGACAYT